MFNLDRPLESLSHIPELPKNEDVSDIEIWNNEYLISCSGGLLTIDIDHPKNAHPIPSFVINEMKVNDKIVDHTSTQKFKYYQNNIHISYSILSYNTNMGYPLYYRVNGGKWKLAPEDNRELELPSLKSNKYTIDFRLGKTNQFPIHSIKFIIKKPLWENYWCWLSIIFAILVIGFIGYGRKLKQLRNRNI